MQTTISPVLAGTQNPFADAAAREAERAARITRYYSEAGGPLLAWLADEARRRGDTPEEMARALGTTVEYIEALKSGHQKVSASSDEFAKGCADYLGIQVIAVKLIADRIPLTDFLQPDESEAEVVQRRFDALLRDPAIRAVMPDCPSALSLEAKRALVRLHAKLTHADPYDTRVLERVVHELQRASLMDAFQATETFEERRDAHRVKPAQASSKDIST